MLCAIFTDNYKDNLPKSILLLTFGRLSAMFVAVHFAKEGFVMFVGREKERAALRSVLDSDKSEFVAVYGRRRIGKTLLIRETYGYRFAFEHTGMKGASTKLNCGSSVSH